MIKKGQGIDTLPGYTKNPFIVKADGPIRAELLRKTSIFPRSFK